MDEQTRQSLDRLKRFICENLLQRPELSASQDRVAIVLAGSRAVGYNTPTSDYDLLGLCDAATYSQVLSRTDHDSSVLGIDIHIDRREAEDALGVQADFAIYEIGTIKAAFRDYNDVVIWIWSNVLAILDPFGWAAEIRASFQHYPRLVLERKLKQHFLLDFNLSVHGLTYRPESGNVFSVLHALTSKIAEYCKMCCLLDGKPYPYDKWLLRACAATRLGQRLAPIFEDTLVTLSSLNGDLPGQWPRVRKAIDAIDTEACEALEVDLAAWGIPKSWQDRSYHELHKVLLSRT